MANSLSQSVSESRVKECEISAGFWATEIGPYASRMRRRADAYAIISALLSALTGLGVWSTLVDSPRLPIVLLVSVVSLSASAVATIPKIKGYGECAEKAALLGPLYGQALGQLKDAREMLRAGIPEGPARAAEAVKRFEEVRAAKEALKPYPAELEEKINAMRQSR